MLKAVIACGGTGGHITPALAIADIIRSNFCGAHIVFVGTKEGMEHSMVTAAGYSLKPMTVIGMPRRISPSVIRALYLAEHACREGKNFLREYAPHIVIGTGGYACYPILRAAAALKIPSAVHESNAVPGLAVRLLARNVDRVWLNFEEAGEHLREKEKLLVVGNPQRQASSKAARRTLPQGCQQMVLSFGGSLGAERINEAVLEMMEWERLHPEIYHLHATGRREYEHFMQRFSAAGMHRARNIEVRPFIADMPEQMAAADVTVCRAGAMSISELAAKRKAAVLIPSPNVTGNHQYINARALADKNAAILLEEGELNGATLIDRVSTLLQNSGMRKGMETQIAQFDHPNANRMIYEDIQYLVKR